MPITIQVSTDGPLKRDLIEGAFGWFGAAAYEFGRTPEEVADALRCLNSMMRIWPWNLLSFNQPTYGLGDPSDYSGIPFDVQDGVTAELAKRVAAVMGASLPPEFKMSAAPAISAVYGYTATIKRMPHDRHTPRGLGSEHVIGIGFACPFIDEDSDDVNLVPVVINAPSDAPVPTPACDDDDECESL